MGLTATKRLEAIDQALKRFDVPEDAPQPSDWWTVDNFASILGITRTDFVQSWMASAEELGFPDPAVQNGGYSGPAEYNCQQGLRAIKALIERDIAEQSKDRKEGRLEAEDMIEGLENDPAVKVADTDHYASGYPIGEMKPLTGSLIGTPGESRLIDMLVPGEPIAAIDRMEELRRVLLLFSDAEIAEYGITIKREAGSSLWIRDALVTALERAGRTKPASKLAEWPGEGASVPITICASVLVELDRLIQPRGDA